LDIPLRTRRRDDTLYVRIAPQTSVIRETESFRPTAGEDPAGSGRSLQRYTVARPEGFEPPTLWSEATCSDPLSYGRSTD
jgi:hypothetical protein